MQLKGFSTTLVVGIIAIVAIAGTAAFFLMRSTTSSGITSGTPVDVSNAGTEPTQSVSNVRATLNDIISREQSLECDWELPEEAEETQFNKGKLWTSDSEGISTITTEINGMSMEANALYKDNIVYAWSEFNGQKIGMKFSQDSVSQMNNRMTAQDRQQAQQIRQEMIVSCQPWSPDESKFIVPADVTFKEM